MGRTPANRLGSDKAAAGLNITESSAAYEERLRSLLRRAFARDRLVRLVDHDLDEKHRKMCNGKRFLRATYWRWAEKILDVCPKLAKAPSVLAVGDIHVENFGTWRDHEGRLVWGVNDFDEAAEMPYALDIIRLATSAFIAAGGGLETDTICDLLLSGYRTGLARPKAIILDHDAEWLYDKVRADARARAKFWGEFGVAPDGTIAPKARRKKPIGLPPTFCRVLSSDCPDGTSELIYQPRTAGGGSLGRPRWVVIGQWRGGPIVREAKAMVSSAWTLPPGRQSSRLRCMEIADGRYRSRDPWYRMSGPILVRRLSPNNRKLDFGGKDLPTEFLPAVLTLMGRDLAAVHLGVEDKSGRISEHLARHPLDWWNDQVSLATEWVRREHKEWIRLSAPLCDQLYAEGS
jgi:hypothetical protein